MLVQWGQATVRATAAPTVRAIIGATIGATAAAGTRRSGGEHS